MRFRHGVLIVAGVLVATLGVAAVGATPAAAHGTSGTEAVVTNYRYRITDFDPGIEGIDLSFIAAVGQLELTNTSDTEVTVLGYSDEPYLRVGPDGTFVNLRSPANYLDNSRDGSAAVPDSADPEAEPRWQKLSDDTTVRWHDHRAHWMAGTPVAVLAEPDAAHELATWTLDLVVGDRTIAATGTTTWVPGPATWPWVLAVLFTIAAGTVLLVTSRWRVWTAVFGAVLLVCGVLLTTGTWRASPSVWSDKAMIAVLPGLFLACLAVGLGLLHRSPRDAGIVVAIGAAGTTVIDGLTRLDHLTSSQLPTTLPSALDRVGVTLVTALGIALVLSPIGRAIRQWLARPEFARPQLHT